MIVTEEFYFALMASALSLAGLASLISLFRSGESFNVGDIFIFRSVISTCLFITIASFLPFLVPYLTTDTPIQMLLLSGIYVIGVSLLLYNDLRRIAGGGLVVVHRLLAFCMITGSMFFIGWAIANMLIWREQMMYVFGLTWGLVVVSIRLYLLFVAATKLSVEEKLAETARHIPPAKLHDLSS